MKLKLQSKNIYSNKSLKDIFNNSYFKILGDCDVKEIKLNNKKKIIYLGKLHIDNCSNDLEFKNFFKELNISNDILSFIKKFKKKVHGRYLAILCDEASNEIYVFSDIYGRFDCFYHNKNNIIEIGSDLSLFEVSPSSEGYDQIGLGHFLSVYGSRPAKKQTIYKNVFRLGVGEILYFNNKNLNLKNIPFEPLETKNFIEDDLNKYSELFLNNLRKYGSDKCNIVYLSSGWDSTSILAGLVHIFGKDKVKAIIGRMRYSKRSSIINPFEIEKAKKIADYFNVNLEIVDFDYSEKISNFIYEVKEEMKKNCVYSGTMNNHGLLAKKANEIDKKASVFCGEISDGVHNLGFSQFISVFHKSKHFREYSDKISSYFYGPTFMEIFQDNKQNEDQLFNFFKSLNHKTIFENNNEKDLSKKRLNLMTSFFLQSKRMPLVSFKNEKIFTKKGIENHYKKMQELYLTEASQKINHKTLYSWYIHLYNSFHWQSSTVVTLPLTSDIFDTEMNFPFYDVGLQNFLSEMPEDFGRGLDLNPTKYPLKWTLKNKIDYPFQLQDGPHAYIYDVDSSFNLAVEMINHSAFAEKFRQALRNHPYKKILSSEIFNLKYIEEIITKYLNGEEIVGDDLNILIPLCSLFFVGVY